MIKHFFLAIFLGIVCLLGYVAYYVGYFKSVTIHEMGPKKFVLIGIKHYGAYHKIVEKIQKVESQIKDLGGDCHESFGIYLDDPAQVEQERLRSFGGCIIQDASWIKDHLTQLSQFQVAEWGAAQLIEAYFEGSPGVGPLKVYPKVSDYVKSRKLKLENSVLELYRMIGDNKMVTYYYFPLLGLESTLF